jgi:membrane glycosyltransferase
LLRRVVYFSLVLLTTALAMGLLVSVFQKNGVTPLESALLILYGLLILWVSTSFWIAAIGFWIQLTGGDKLAISRQPARPGADADGSPLRTVVVMPVYNEDPERVFAGLRSIWQSLQETGCGDAFDLFVLSDTRSPQCWVQEELNWYQLCEDLNAHGRIFYRNRVQNTARKSGNIAEFCEHWGGHYRYMIVLDADSIMGGATLVKMVEVMEGQPQVALLQTPPVPVGHDSLFVRVLQFSSSLYGSMFTAGLNFWQMYDGNYWGHNAIIRLKPFTEHCHLPKLPGNEPFGGEIFSHDFVEAALLRRAGWEVWLAYDLGESYEELPTTLIDYAKRDRRWCQGNLQHVGVLGVRGMRPLSRLYMLMGIMSYLSSPLWGLFLIVTGIEAYNQTQTVPVYFFGDNWYPVWPESYTVEMTTVLFVTLGMLFLPKILGLLLLLCQWRRLKYYGGLFRVGLSVLLETLFTTLIAPVLMLYQSKFVLAILSRRSVGWPPQQRGDHRLGFSEAVAAHYGHTLVGAVAGWLSYTYVPDFFLWLTPVLAGLLLSVPVSMYSSSTHIGQCLRRWGLFQTPEECDPPRVLRLLEDNLEKVDFWSRRAAGRAEEVMADAAVVSLHQGLLPRQLFLPKRQHHQLRALTYQLLEDGSESLSQQEKRAILSDAETLLRLHTLAASGTAGSGKAA